MFISVVVTEISYTTEVSVSRPGGPDCSSGCGVPPVDSGWSPGGTHKAAPATGGGVQITLSDGYEAFRIEMYHFNKWHNFNNATFNLSFFMWNKNNILNKI